MPRVFGTAVFVPVFLVSIGLLLDPSVMFTGEALKLAGLIIVAALGGKTLACWIAGAWLPSAGPNGQRCSSPPNRKPPRRSP